MNKLINIKIKEICYTSHEDLILNVPKNGFCAVFDSYYLGLDSKVKTNLIGYKKIKFVLICLIEYWIKCIQESGSGTVLCLPIDFSDQYIGCFRVKKEQRKLFISYGYTFTEGFSVSPSNPGTFCTNVDDFEKEDTFSSFVVSQTEFIDALNENIAKLRQQFK